jgi:hypothetical protein
MCKQYLVLTLFNKHRGTKDGMQTACRACLKEASKKWDLNPVKRRQRKLRSKYNLTTDQFNEMLLNQDNKCAICRGTETNNKKNKYFNVDHCHSTGKVRGLLCDYCNVGLGRFKDDIIALQNAIEYLKTHCK